MLHIYMFQENQRPLISQSGLQFGYTHTQGYVNMVDIRIIEGIDVQILNFHVILSHFCSSLRNNSEALLVAQWQRICLGEICLGENLPRNVGDMGSISGLGRFLGEGNGIPLQYSCLENPWTEEPGGLQSDTTQQLNNDSKESIFILSTLLFQLPF